MRPPLNKDTQVCISLAARPSNIGTRFHNHLYEQLGLDFIYKAFTTTDIAAAIGGVRALGIRGCSVSMPFKRDVIALVDDVEDSARAIDAVNTIRQRRRTSDRVEHRLHRGALAHRRPPPRRGGTGGHPRQRWHGPGGRHRVPRRGLSRRHGCCAKSQGGQGISRAARLHLAHGTRAGDRPGDRQRDTGRHGRRRRTRQDRLRRRASSSARMSFSTWWPCRRDTADRGGPCRRASR